MIATQMPSHPSLLPKRVAPKGEFLADPVEGFALARINGLASLIHMSRTESEETLLLKIFHHDLVSYFSLKCEQEFDYRDVYVYELIHDDATLYDEQRGVCEIAKDITCRLAAMMPPPMGSPAARAIHGCRGMRRPY